MRRKNRSDEAGRDVMQASVKQEAPGDLPDLGVGVMVRVEEAGIPAEDVIHGNVMVNRSEI